MADNQPDKKRTEERFVWKPSDLQPAQPTEAKRVWDAMPPAVKRDLESKGWVDGIPPPPK